jgi:hypothetical protein
MHQVEFRETLRACGKRDAVIIAETGGLPFAICLIEPGREKTFHVNWIQKSALTLSTQSV